MTPRIIFGAAVALAFAACSGSQEASTSAASSEPAAATASTTSAPTGEVVASGTWTKKTQSSDGAWTITETDSGEMVLSFDETFSTRNAPDLKVFLSPLTVAEVENGNATEGSLFLAPLSDNKGAQSYTLPADVDLASYKSVLIHCEQFTKLWSAGAL